MPHRCVLANCSNTVNTENGSFVHAIPFFGDLRPEAKKLSKKLGGLRKDKTSSMGTYEVPSSLFEALQTMTQMFKDGIIISFTVDKSLPSG